MATGHVGAAGGCRVLVLASLAALIGSASSASGGALICSVAFQLVLVDWRLETVERAQRDVHKTTPRLRVYQTKRAPHLNRHSRKHL
jgi:hypothetical protein